MEYKYSMKSSSFCTLTFVLCNHLSNVLAVIFAHLRGASDWFTMYLPWATMRLHCGVYCFVSSIINELLLTEFEERVLESIATTATSSVAYIKASSFIIVPINEPSLSEHTNDILFFHIPISLPVVSQMCELQVAHLTTGSISGGADRGLSLGMKEILLSYASSDDSTA